MKKKIISFFISLSLCFTFLVPYSVSAATVPESFQVPYLYGDSVTSEDYEILKTQLIDLFDRCNLDSDDFYIYSRVLGNNYYFIYIFDKQGTFKNLTYNSSQYNNFKSVRYAYLNTSSLGSVNSLSFTDNSNSYVPFFLSYNTVDKYYAVTQISNYGNDNTFFNAPVNYADSVFISDINYIPSYVPPPSVLYGLDLDINETDFYNWIMDNNKLVELPNYITANKLLSFIQFYKKFGGSFTNFLKNIPDWFTFMNIANQSSDNVNALKSAMDKLYQEYINSYWHAIYPDFSGLPHHRRNIQTNTTDTNTTLITDDSDDTVDTSILRDILRGIISINNSLSDGVISIINKLDGINFTVNVANGGGSFSAAEIWGSGDITESSNYQALSDVFVQHGVVISNVENLQYNYLAGQTQKDSFTVSVDMPDEYLNGEFTKKTITHTVDSNSKMYDTLVLFRKIIALAVILFYVVRLKLALPDLIKGE